MSALCFAGCFPPPRLPSLSQENLQQVMSLQKAAVAVDADHRQKKGCSQRRSHESQDFFRDTWSTNVAASAPAAGPLLQPARRLCRKSAACGAALNYPGLCVRGTAQTWKDACLISLSPASLSLMERVEEHTHSVKTSLSLSQSSFKVIKKRFARLSCAKETQTIFSGKPLFSLVKLLQNTADNFALKRRIISVSRI